MSDSFEKEYQSVRSRAGLIDLSLRGRLCASGKDRLPFLQRLLSIDVKALGSGDCRTGCFLTGKAALLAVLDVSVTEDAVWIDTHESSARHVAGLFEKVHFSEEVHFEDVTRHYAEFALEGPQSEERLREWKVRPMLLAAKSLSGEKGFRFWLPVTEIDRLSELKAERVGPRALEALRIEAGEPCFGIDMDETTLLPELGRDEWASTTKGCYAGQEVIQRVRNFGHANRLLVRLVADTDQSITGGAVLEEGKPVGRITSSVFSPGLKRTAALGTISYRNYVQDKKVDVEIQGKRYTAALR